MSNAPTSVSDYDAIAKVVQHYIDGAKSGRGDDMKPAFHKDATVFGYVGARYVSIPLRHFFSEISVASRDLERPVVLA